MTRTAPHLTVPGYTASSHAPAFIDAWLQRFQRARSAGRSDRASEAAEVRELAYRYASTDPSFADDLYAAANRHEALAHV